MSFGLKIRRQHSLSFGSGSPRLLAKAIRSGSRGKTKWRKRSNTIDFGNLITGNPFKILQIQEKFPHDNLRLTETPESPTLYMKTLAHRRRSAPNAVLSKILNKSSSNLSIDGGSRGSPPPPNVSPPALEAKPRTYIQEGCVQLSTGMSSQTRHLFLFNDILLVAKSKSVSTYKLKNKVRISEMWIGTCIDEVTESTVSAEKSFVIGWPTTNFVASFSTTEEKELWWLSLSKCIHEQRELEDRREIALKVCKRDMEDASVITKSLAVSTFDDANTVTKMALNNFHLINENASDYQLWVISGKENIAYPLIGHEIPFAIKMNHVREAFMEGSGRNVNNNVDNDPNLNTLFPESKCEFVLKKARKPGTRINLDIPSAQKRWRNPMKKSPIINWAMNKKGSKNNMPQDLIPPGKLFGLPLTSLTTNEELVPKPVEDILVQLFRRGPSTVGIFRKSGLMKSMKQVRQALNEGLPVELDEKPVALLSTILKEFFRSLPDCIFGSEFYDEFVTTKEKNDVTSRAEEVKKILNKLPKPNQELIKRFLCLAYFVAKYSERNSMTASNLAVCIAPSLIWPPGQEKLMSPETTGNAAEFICFVIENFIEIYGEDCLNVLGVESDICLEAPQDDEPETTGESMIFHCQQEDENPPKPIEFRTCISYSDEYHGTEDNEGCMSEERLNLSNSLNLTSVSLFPGKIGDSKSSPSSPFPSRKKNPINYRMYKPLENGFLDDKGSTRRHSEDNLFDDLGTRNTSKYTRVKRSLISTTTSAELIEHKRSFQSNISAQINNENSQSRGSSPQTVKVMSPSSVSPKMALGGFFEATLPQNVKENSDIPDDRSRPDSPSDSDKASGSSRVPKISTGSSNLGSETSSSDGRNSPRSPLSSPVLRKTFFDGKTTQADIVMQNYYKRQQPAAPSYDEYIHRRQLLQKSGTSQRQEENEKQFQGRSQILPIDQPEMTTLNRKLELALNVINQDVKKFEHPQTSKNSHSAKMSSVDIQLHHPEKETKQPQQTSSSDVTRIYLSAGRENVPLVKTSPKPPPRKVETEPFSIGKSTTYPRTTAESFGCQDKQRDHTLSKLVFENDLKRRPKLYEKKSASTNVIDIGNLVEPPAQETGSVGIAFTGKPVRPTLAHFPTSGFFHVEAKSRLAQPNVSYQSPWFREGESQDTKKGNVENNSDRQREDNDSTYITPPSNKEVRKIADIDVSTITHLTDLETPTLEDFQNFMFQDESRV